MGRGVTAEGGPHSESLWTKSTPDEHHVVMIVHVFRFRSAWIHFKTKFTNFLIYFVDFVVRRFVD
jgi:hypothetical protein